MTDVPTIAGWLALACERWAAARDELTELDAAAGDGDLGVTVAAGATGVAAALAGLPADVTLPDLVRCAGAAFARGNPSSFAALTGAGLLAAAKYLDTADSDCREAVAGALDAAADRIAERGRAAVGERTVLDALVPSVTALRSAPPGRAAALTAMVAAARVGVAATSEMPAVRGRAAWVGERSAGIPDAGATAYLRLLEALASVAQA
ncbi:DAK2 domain-containing protein [Actinocatenispora comari]|uniref:DhaL domain-containing protein n=1 Tax=Actinocatenispora comari TaxID=2807577 RepID=A0A8J4EKH0_9ACTN|nr:DAK2 domain-containing protein [Actinocatenispora comari]GIL28192.1 hypothetical protein NUM_34460 [Actinocatenispora comari]